MLILQIILVVLIFLIVGGSGVLFVMNKETARKNRIIGVIQGQGSGGGKKDSAQDKQDKRRADIAKKLKEKKNEEKIEDKNKKATLPMLIEQAGLGISVAKYWIFSSLLMFTMIGFAKVMGWSSFVMMMCAVIGLFGLPRLVLKKMAQRRQKKFLQEFPDALEATVRLLKAGMPVSEAIMMCAREFTGPVGEEMSRIYDKQKIGVPLHEAAYEATRRIPLPEMQMFATGMAIQAQTGASLSEVLMNLSGVIRARFKLKRKVKALSSEAVASASIIGALPNVVALGLYFANRDYIMLLFTDPFGKILLGVAIAWMCVGIFVMRIMINFKI